MNAILKESIREFLKVESIKDKNVEYQIISEEDKGKYTQRLISYPGYGEDIIKAFMLIPKGAGPFPAVLVHHQNNGERFLGKSEVCGSVGDLYQAFGPSLANRGIIVLAPDSICFEERRNFYNYGAEPNEEMDWLQHYNEMCYRILKGETLIKKVLEDAAIGISLLRINSLVNNSRIGVLGHSYGGITVLFQGALDSRITFACSSGAVCSYKNKIMNGTGKEMATVIPGFINMFEIEDLVKCFAPKNLLIVSANEDKYSRDADKIFEVAKETYKEMDVEDRLEHKRYSGGHSLDEERFNYIVDWIISECHKRPDFA